MTKRCMGRRFNGASSGPGLSIREEGKEVTAQLEPAIRKWMEKMGYAVIARFDNPTTVVALPRKCEGAEEVFGGGNSLFDMYGTVVEGKSADILLKAIGQSRFLVLFGDNTKEAEVLRYPDKSVAVDTLGNQKYFAPRSVLGRINFARRDDSNKRNKSKKGN